MKEIFDIIENTFGTGTLQLVSVAMIIYFAVVGVSRLYETFRRISSQRDAVIQEKERLEILKLQYEIEGLKKTHNLEEMPSLAEIPAPVSRQLPEPRPTMLDRFSGFLLSHGRFGAAILYVSCGFLQLIGWLAVGLIVVAVRYYLAGNALSPEEIYVPITGGLVGAGSLYQGLVGLGRRLRQHSSRGYTITRFVTLALGIGATIFALSIQQV